jgi:hypothetical protein
MVADGKRITLPSAIPDGSRQGCLSLTKTRLGDVLSLHTSLLSFHIANPFSTTNGWESIKTSRACQSIFCGGKRKWLPRKARIED